LAASFTNPERTSGGECQCRKTSPSLDHLVGADEQCRRYGSISHPIIRPEGCVEEIRTGGVASHPTYHAFMRCGEYHHGNSWCGKAFHVFHCHRRFTMESITIPPPTLTSFNKYRKVSNIDQRVTIPSRHTAAITAPFRHPSVTESSVALPPDLTGGICCPIHNRPIYRLAWRAGLVVPNASRAWRSSILPHHVPDSSTGPCGAPSAGLSTRLR